MTKTLTVIAILVALAGIGPVAAADLPGRTIAVKVAPQAWQVRRAEVAATVKAINDSRGKDQEAVGRLDGVLTAFEGDPLSITPLEAMDLYGVFYVPNEGATNIKGLLKMVASYAALGWYDALRFGDASGREEIRNNEGFFRRAFQVGNDDGTKQLLELMTNHPDDAAEAVQAGIAFARTVRNDVHYDTHWPSAYGLARMRCGMEGAKDCPPPPSLPKEQWDAAFTEAATVVEHYYRNER